MGRIRPLGPRHPGCVSVSLCPTLSVCLDRHTANGGPKGLILPTSGGWGRSVVGVGQRCSIWGAIVVWGGGGGKCLAGQVSARLHSCLCVQLDMYVSMCLAVCHCQCVQLDGQLSVCLDDPATVRHTHHAPSHPLICVSGCMCNCPSGCTAIHLSGAATVHLSSWMCNCAPIHVSSWTVTRLCLRLDVELSVCPARQAPVHTAVQPSMHSAIQLSMCPAG